MRNTRWKRWIAAALLLLLAASVGWAQNGEPTLGEINARLAQLGEPEKDLPDDQFRLSDEARKIDDELLRYSRLRDFLDASGEDAKRLTKVKALASAAIKEIKDSDAANVQAGQFDRLVAKLYKVQNFIAMSFDDFDVIEVNPWPSLTGDPPDPNGTVAARAAKLKGAVTNEEKDLIAYLDAIGVPIDAAAKANGDKKTAVVSLLDKLQKRRTAIQAHVRELAAQNEIGGSLWKIIAVIALFSIATMALILKFPRAIQTEWVASGQVIQLLTVMILLSVIMALGLSNILKENTLGTLLGGLAGYVLSQGIGRAAAREVSRGFTNAAGAAAAGAAAGAAAAGAAAATPAVTGVAPNTGPAAGGTSVRITGSGFVAGATVAFGGTPATVQRVEDATAITVAAPAHAAGAVDVVVTNVGGRSATAPNAYNYA